jgi:hypothetical protein
MGAIGVHYSGQNENLSEQLRESSKGMYAPVNALQAGCNFRTAATLLYSILRMRFWYLHV